MERDKKCSLTTLVKRYYSLLSRNKKKEARQNITLSCHHQRRHISSFHLRKNGTIVKKICI